MPQHVRPLAPEGRDWLANRDVGRFGVTVDVARVHDFCQRGRRDQVDLRMREGLQGLDVVGLTLKRGHGEGIGPCTYGNAKLFCQRVDLGVFEQLYARLVDGR